MLRRCSRRRKHKTKRLPPCSPADIAHAQALEGDATRLVILAATIESMGELLSFGAEQLAWRDEMWAKLPHCDEVLAYGLALEQLSETLVMKLLLQSAGIAADDNPYVELGIESAKEVNRLERGFADAGDDDAATTTTLPACSAEERLSSSPEDFWAGIVDLVDTLHAVKSFEALLGYIDATLAWRAEVWSATAALRGSLRNRRLERALHRRHRQALYARFVRHRAGGQSLRQDLPDRASCNSRIICSGSTRPAGITRSLPACAETPYRPGPIRQALRSYRDWNAMPRLAQLAELPAFAEAHITWRETLLAVLRRRCPAAAKPSRPRC